MNKVNTIFMGTSDFAVPILAAALDDPLLNILAVVTQPDRPVGRHQNLTPPAVKQFLIDKKLNIDILQPERIREVSEELISKYNPELILVASYGQIIPNNLLDYPKYKALNFHGSLLPKLRGATPVNMAILQGFEKTGVTLQVMAEKMDVGDIISTREYILKNEETAESLMQELSILSVEILKDDLKNWIAGKIQPVKQNDSEATYCSKNDISKEIAEIKFETEVDLAERMVRAFYPWPVAWINLPGKGRVKIFKAVKSPNPSSGNFEITRDKDRLFLNLKEGTIELLQIQLEGKKGDFAKIYLYLAS